MSARVSDGIKAVKALADHWRRDADYYERTGRPRQQSEANEKADSCDCVLAALTAAEQRAEALTAQVNAAWNYLEHAFDIESRAELEQQAKTNGFKYGLVQAIHHTWKRDPKVSALTAKGERLTAAADIAIETIRVWHGMGMGASEAAEAWGLYQSSPEMRRLREALSPDAPKEQP